jgi:RNA polymerase sigma-B factor
MTASSLLRDREITGLTDDDPTETLRALAALPPRHPSRPAVRAQAIESWLPLANHLAHRFAGRGEPLPDLVQTAVVGLIKAIDRFDTARGDGFAAFAVPTILGEIKRYFRDQAWVLHVPRRLQELRLALAEARETLTQRLGHPPTPAELAADLRLPEEEVREGMCAARAYTAASLDAPARDGTGEPGPPLGELLGEEDADLAHAELRMTVAPALATLPDRERRILHLRFVGNLTQDQIADRVGISQMHVSRLLARSLDMLREELLRDGTDGVPVAVHA